MGFSVTASAVIFGVALLAAGSAATQAYWKVQGDVEEAKRLAAQRADDVAHTLLEWDAEPSYNGGPDRLTFEILNSGSTVVDISDLDYIIDGQWNDALESGWPKVGGSTTSDVLLPGETLEVRMQPIAASPDTVKVVTGTGVSLYWD